MEGFALFILLAVLHDDTVLVVVNYVDHFALCMVIAGSIQTQLSRLFAFRSHKIHQLVWRFEGHSIVDILFV
jgi:hypothetical protein